MCFGKTVILLTLISFQHTSAEALLNFSVLRTQIPSFKHHACFYSAHFFWGECFLTYKFTQPTQRKVSNPSLSFIRGKQQQMFILVQVNESLSLAQLPQQEKKCMPHITMQPKHAARQKNKRVSENSLHTKAPVSVQRTLLPSAAVS